MSSFIVATTCHARPVSYLVIRRNGSHSWTINRDEAYRFPSAAVAIHYGGSTIDGGNVAVLADERPATVDMFPPIRSRVTSPPIGGERPPLEPWRMSSGQKIAMAALVVFLVMMAVALVNGW